MPFGLDHLFHATRFRGPATWYFDMVDEWRAKRDAILVLLEDMPRLIEEDKNSPTQPHPTNPNMGTIDPRPGIRLVIACEGIANSLYSAAEVAANFAHHASRSAISSSFNNIRKHCEGDQPPEFVGCLGDLQWYRKVRELRTEWAHYSSIFVGRDDRNEPILCVRAFRRMNDRKEFGDPRTFCRAHELCEWVQRAMGTLERFAGYLLIRYVIPMCDLEQRVTWMVRDDLGFPRFNDHGGIVTEGITYREYLCRGGIEVTGV